MLKFLLGGLSIALIILLFIKVPITFLILITLMFVGNAIVEWKENKFMVVFDAIVVILLIKLIAWLVS